uniref:Uncharacterized protein n=1 Tax=Opuntia streptacantha TaxID=393608 RepID=A0A7C8ZUT2_OPUST
MTPIWTQNSTQPNLPIAFHAKLLFFARQVRWAQYQQPQSQFEPEMTQPDLKSYQSEHDLTQRQPSLNLNQTTCLLALVKQKTELPLFILLGSSILKVCYVSEVWGRLSD